MTYKAHIGPDRARSVFVAVSEETGVPIAAILGPERTQRVFRARREVYRRLRDMGASYPTIGQIVGRDHTSVLAALR